MLEFLFYFFAALTLLSGMMVATSRNLVNGAMYMILTFVGMAGMFILLEAYFLAALQILVYAGAVVVLFLFIIMLLNVEKEAKSRLHEVSVFASLVFLTFIAAGVITLLSPESLTPPVAYPEAPGADPENYARILFTKYMLPFQMAGFLLLVAMIGVILLSKRRSLPQPATEIPTEQTPNA